MLSARVTESSDFVPAYFELAGLEEFHKGTMEPSSTSVPGESSPNPCLSSSHPKVSQFSFSPYVLALYELMPLCWSLQQVGL